MFWYELSLHRVPVPVIFIDFVVKHPLEKTKNITHPVHEWMFTDNPCTGQISLSLQQEYHPPLITRALSDTRRIHPSEVSSFLEITSSIRENRSTKTDVQNQTRSNTEAATALAARKELRPANDAHRLWGD